MTPDERQMLSDLANKFAQTPAPPRDAEAEEFIRTRIGSRPDALYLMTQTVLIQNLAIEQAQHQIEELKQQSPQTARPAAGSSLLGTQPPPRPGTPSYSQGQYAAPPPPQYAAPSPSGPSPGGSGPSFLRGAAQTAAGVAAGALAFEGIRSLFSHPGYGGAGFGGFGGSPVEETVINNYYDTPPHEAGQQFADTSDDAAQLQDASYNDTQNDGGQFANTDYDLGDDGSDFGGDSGDSDV
jgi:uncharacterized protein